jgi:hypothetical protein
MAERLAYSVDEAAAVVGLSPRTLDRAITAGDLRCKRTAKTKDDEPAGKKVILRRELEAWLEKLPDA